jgi:glucoamylase
MVRRAAAYIVQTGPSTPEDRWEEDAGLTPYSLGCMIAALLIAADMADANDEQKLGTYLRETADAWNDSIERWTYVQDTALARKVGVDGYYLRIAPPETLSGKTSVTDVELHIPNLPKGKGTFPAQEIVSVDSLAMVRFGLRAADDPKILNTVKVIDAVLKVETPKGSSWHRYNHDGYGEHADGSPFDGAGIGRIWPLFAGERAHFELAAGNIKEARRLLGVMEALAGDSGLISEQVWDTAPIPEKDLHPGRPSGSARPLVWAHAEHVKLLRSLKDGAVFDMPPLTVKRYLVDHKHSSHFPWRFKAQIQELPKGLTLRIETSAATTVHWSIDGWENAKDTHSCDSGIGLFVTDLPTKSLPIDTRIVFTFHWCHADRWEKKDFSVVVAAALT